MDSLARFNEALSYIEANLTGSVNFKEAARMACCSEYHFTRMFSLLAGVTLSEYVRRRRLTLAALELTGTDAKIIDVALKFGYASPDAFNRAYQSMHGVTPSESRNPGQPLKAFPRMSFQLTIQGGSEMNYRIEIKEAFRIAGIKKRVPIVFSGVNPEIAAMYSTLTPELIHTIKSLSNTEPRGIISASSGFSDGRMQEEGELDHYIGAATTGQAPGELATLEIQASAWAVFTAVGPFPGTLQDIWGRIYSEWFPTSDYELNEGPELLWNEHPDVTAADYKSEIWIPVKRR